jgi:putative transposase
MRVAREAPIRISRVGQPTKRWLDRRVGWLTRLLHQTFRELMLHAAARQRLMCPIYCLMPDHIHLVWMGTATDSDQLNGMAFLRTYLELLLAPAQFQVQPHDHVLSEKERKRRAFAMTCCYLRDNPVRAKLVTNGEDWPFMGAVISGYPKLAIFEPNYWDKFWRISRSGIWSSLEFGMSRSQGRVSEPR